MSADTNARVHRCAWDRAKRSCVRTQIGYRSSCGSGTKTTCPHPCQGRPRRHCQGLPACANVPCVNSTPVTHDGDLLWTPSPDKVARANLTAFTTWLARERGL